MVKIEPTDTELRILINQAMIMSALALLVAEPMCNELMDSVSAMLDFITKHGVEIDKG